jgi:hypothetical protein
MAEVPAQLLKGLSPADEALVAAWWARLDAAARSQVTDLCDPRRDQCFFRLVPGDAAQAPVVIGGRFVPKDDDTAGWDEWHAGLFDYLVCNPELVLVAPPVVRTSHICTRHEAARAVLAAGRIPVDFQCPLSSDGCPIRHLLSVAPNESLQQPRAALRLFVVNCPASGPGC